MGLFSPYIKEEWKPSIKAYKFKGVDNSIFYRFVTSPFANKVVQYIPEYIA